MPPEARSAFGERLSASMSLLIGKYRLSKRLVEEVLADLGSVQVSVGSVSNLEEEMSAALKLPVEQAEAYVHEARVVHADETGWAQGVKAGRAARAWLWGGERAGGAESLPAKAVRSSSRCRGRTSWAGSSRTGGARTTGTTRDCANSAGRT